MKKLVLLFVFTIVAIATLHAQNDIKARIELEDAEKAYSEMRYDDALKHLDKTQELIGRWSHQIGYLRILSLDAICDYGANEIPLLPKLQSEVKLYMDYANKNSGSIERDKFREIYAVEDRVLSAIERPKGTKIQEYEDAYELNFSSSYTFSKQMELYLKAAEKGSAGAMHEIGCLYDYAIPRDATEDKAKAKEWYLKAAAKGVGMSMVNIGEMYQRENNYTEAERWFVKASECGYTHSLGKFYAQNGRDNEAEKCFLKAIEQGSRFVTYELGKFYEIRGKIDLAKKYYKICTESNNFNTSKAQEALQRLENKK